MELVELVPSMSLLALLLSCGESLTTKSTVETLGLQRSDCKSWHWLCKLSFTSLTLTLSFTSLALQLTELTNIEQKAKMFQ